ncbi:hypothetical protein QA802_39215 [Streptomyces sp. B21-105]|uniref:hypothetical protein n=1 Tax=Streptomyces sp. B21-105 TaxID=3039417 RepID=UPI002FEF7842
MDLPGHVCPVRGLPLVLRLAAGPPDGHPARAALAEDDPRPDVSGGFRSYRQFFGFVGSAVAVLAVAALTAGRLRVVLLWVIVPLLVTALSYLDFRQARAARAGS